MFEPGTIIGRDYRVVRPLGEGGMGAVFVAEQISTGALRAVKVLHGGLLQTRGLAERFQQEARIAARIPSEHVVQVIGAGIDDVLHAPWLAMELLAGRTLREAAEQHGIDRTTALTAMAQVAHAVDAAHHAGIVHRDLKPENLFLAESHRQSGEPWTLKVLDFGIAYVRTATVSNTAAIGTPSWMAPEQAVPNGIIGPWTDVWAFGLLGFWLLTGKELWRASQSECAALSALTELLIEPLPLASERAAELGRAGSLPPAFDAWFSRCIDRDASGRFASVREAHGAFRLLFAPSDGATAFGTTRLAMAQFTPSQPIVLSVSPPRARIARPALVAGFSTLVVLAIATAASAGAYVAKHRPPPTTAELVATCGEGDRAACERASWQTAFPRGGGRGNYVSALELAMRACDDLQHCAMVGVATSYGWPDAHSVVDAGENYRRSCAASGQGIGCALWAIDLARRGKTDGPAFVQARDWAARAQGAACAAGLSECGLYLAVSAAEHRDLVGDLPAVHAACEAGDPTSCNNLALYELDSTSDHRLPSTASRELLQKACDIDEAAACNNLAVLDARLPAALRVDVRGALEYRLACGGRLHFGCTGEGHAQVVASASAPNLVAAAAGFEAACAKGNDVGCMNSASFHEAGLGTEHDGVAAAEKLQFACNDLGSMVACGEYAMVKRLATTDHAAEAQLSGLYLESACLAGAKDSCMVHAELQASGSGVAQDKEAAERTLRELCDRENAKSCVALSNLEQSGILGTKEDVAILDARACALSARECYRMPARQVFSDDADESARGATALGRLCDGGDSDACAELGIFFLSTKGPLRDESRSLQLTSRACVAGESRACAYVSAALMMQHKPELAEDGRATAGLGCNEGYRDPESCIMQARWLESGSANERARAKSLFHVACVNLNDPASFACKRDSGETVYVAPAAPRRAAAPVPQASTSSASSHSKKAP